MANIVGAIPEFTQDESSPVDEGLEEVKEAPVEEAVVEEKETPVEPPATEQPAPQGEDTRLEKQVQGLQSERVKLLKEISELKGQRREIKQDQLLKVETQIDELKDVHPQDVQLIDKILRTKGYMTKEEAGKMFYDSVKQDVLNSFLEKYPEYKPENDVNDVNWVTLQRELGYYRMPEDPHKITDILERAHRAVTPSRSDQNLPAKKRQIEIASVGSGGVARSSSRKSLDPEKAAMLRQGGFTDEDIKAMEDSL